jgi:hypothetical protein
VPVGIDHVAEAVRTRKIAEQIIEGAVLGINYHDCFDFIAQRSGSRVASAAVRLDDSLGERAGANQHPHDQTNGKTLSCGPLL